jgi:heme/copper-type cytochrome/quinol oxidase subunit 2
VNDPSRSRSLFLRVFVSSWLHLILLLAGRRVAFACPVCFGQIDSALAAAMNLGIVFMLVIVVGVLAAFASFFIYLMRRARMAARQSESTALC